MHIERRKRLSKHLASAISFLSLSDGQLIIDNMIAWKKSNDELAVFLDKQGIPITGWQADRIIKKIANECLVTARHKIVDETFGDIKEYGDTLDPNEIKKVACAVSLPVECILGATLSLFEDQPYKYSIYIPLAKLNSVNQQVAISDKITLSSSAILSEDLLTYIKNKESRKSYDYEEPDTVLMPLVKDVPLTYRGVTRPRIKPVESNYKIKDILSRSFIRIELEGLIFSPIKYEPELSILKSRLRQLVALLEIMNFIDKHMTYDIANEREVSSYVYIKNESQNINNYAVLNVTLDEIEMFKTLTFNKTLYDAELDDSEISSPRNIIGKLLSDDSGRTARLINGLDWYGYSLMKSFSGSDVTFEYISYVMAIEALLGDERPRASMTEALADKVAYSLCSSVEDRDTLRMQFLDLYDFRCKLLHGRKTHFGIDDTSKLNDLKNMTQDIIRKEISLLYM